MSIFGKFVSHSFKKEGYKIIQCDVPVIGQFLVEKAEDPKRRDMYDFIPSSVMSNECFLHKTASVFLVDPNNSLKKDLQIGKIAEVAQIGVDQAQNMLGLMVK